jgi:uncharacterized protein
MKFYNRQNELKILEKSLQRSQESAQMTVITGRRRIGKTSLARKAFSNSPVIYLFISRKSESLLCEEAVQTIESSLNTKILGKFHHFAPLFEYLLRESVSRPFTLILDEFQDFTTVNPSFFSDLQNLWDQYKEKSKMNLIISGSVYSMMKKIFEDAGEPLFGRANERIFLPAFTIPVLKEILNDIHPQYTAEDLLALYTITGGVPKYVELMAEKNCFTLSDMLQEIFREHSIFLNEGKYQLIEEFGKEYAGYFSILSLIASSKTSRSEIESILEKNIGGYLERLEKDYQIIEPVRPFLAKPASRIVKYQIKDSFLAFWFRFVYKYQSTVEIGNFPFLINMVNRDFPTYSGPFLERYFREILALSNRFTRIGRYWEKGNQNEIDIVALDDAAKTALFVEVKRDAKRINLNQLQVKSEAIRRNLPDYQSEYRGLSMKDMLNTDS